MPAPNRAALRQSQPGQEVPVRPDALENEKAVSVWYSALC